eukprot:3310856-Amphidinium_carterae.1
MGSALRHLGEVQKYSSELKAAHDEISDCRHAIQEMTSDLANANKRSKWLEEVLMASRQESERSSNRAQMFEDLMMTTLAMDKRDPYGANIVWSLERRQVEMQESFVGHLTPLKERIDAVEAFSDNRDSESERSFIAWQVGRGEKKNRAQPPVPPPLPVSASAAVNRNQPVDSLLTDDLWTTASHEPEGHSNQLTSNLVGLSQTISAAFKKSRPVETISSHEIDTSSSAQ